MKNNYLICFLFTYCIFLTDVNISSQCFLTCVYMGKLFCREHMFHEQCDPGAEIHPTISGELVIAVPGYHGL